jgi:hypothetical protein
MKSLRRFEGYYQLDHRESPGNALAPEGKQFESATLTCSHCNYIVIVHRDRSRPRGYCPKCDRYVCDACEVVRVTQGCRNLDALIGKMREEDTKKEDLIKKLRIL